MREQKQSPPQEKQPDVIKVADDDLATGVLIESKYKVLSVLGHGGMATVYKVEQILLNKQFALKMIGREAFSENSWRRFQKDAQAISRLSHPNIVKAYEFGLIDGNQPYLVMDLVEGETLGTRLKRAGQLTIKEVVDLFIPICFALSYAHQEGIIHRDLKPSNIVLSVGNDGKREPKIVDFGIAKVIDEDSEALTRTGEVFGTPHYMSPEQCRGDQIDARCDIYALGCVMFEALTGTPPFPGSSAVSIIAQHITAQPPTLKEASMGGEFPRVMEKLIARMLAKQAEDRVQSLQEVTQTLIELQRDIDAGNIPSIASGPQSIHPGPAGANQQRTKGPLLAWAGGAALVAMLAIGILIGMGLSHPKEAEPLPSTDQSDFMCPMGNNFFSFPAGQSGKRNFCLPKEARGVVLNSNGVTCKAGQQRLLDWPGVCARIDTGWTGHYPQYLMSFRPDDLFSVAVVDHSSAGNDKALTASCMAFMRDWKSVVDLNCLENNYVDDLCLSNTARWPLLKVQLRGSGITGDGLARMPWLSRLDNLRLEDASIPGPALRALAESNRRIKHLLILHTSLNAEDLKSISKLSSLEELRLEGVQGFNPEDIRCLSNLHKLKDLCLNDSPVDDNLAVVLEGMPDLRTLAFMQTKVSDACAPAISNLVNLKILKIAFSRMDDVALKSFANLKLHWLEYGTTNFTPAARPYLVEMRRNGTTTQSVTETGQPNIER